MINKYKTENRTKSKRSGLLLILTGLIALCALTAMFLLSGCDLIRGKSNYEIAVENGFEGTENEWLETLKGEKGDEGQAGADGTVWLTGTVPPDSAQGSDGNYYLDTSESALYKKTDGEWELLLSFKQDAPCNHAFGAYTVTRQTEDGEYWIAEARCTVKDCGYYFTRLIPKEYPDSSAEYIADSAEMLSAMLGSKVERVLLPDGADITLNSNITATGCIEIKKGSTVNIDLNGHSLVSSCACPLIKNYGTLTIDDGGNGGAVYTTNVEAQGRAAVSNYGDITINGGKFGSSKSRGQALSNLGTATVNGGEFTACDNYVNGGYAYAIGNGSSKYPDAVMTINDATVYGKMNGALANDGGTMTVKGGTYTLGDGDSANNFYMAYSSSGEIVIEGGAFTRNVKNDHGFIFTAGGTVNLIGGSFTDAVNDDIIIGGGYITKISAQFDGCIFKVKNSRVAVKDGVSVTFSQSQTEMNEEYSMFDGYSQYSNDVDSNVYYYWDTEDGATAGEYIKLESVINKGYLSDGEYIRLIKNVSLSADLAVKLTEGSFNLILGSFGFEGDGKLIISDGVTVICDGECAALKAAEGCSLTAENRDGKYIYSVIAN